MARTRNTVIRSMHDVGLAGWFGGSLMGAVGLNGATKDIADPTDRIRIASAGWARWAPVAAAAIGTHALGGAGLLITERDRVRHQSGVKANTVVKAVLTGAAMASTAYSGVLGARLASSTDAAEGATAPDARTGDETAAMQQQQRVLQWITPALTGVLLVLGAQQGEQQKPADRVRGVVAKALR